MNSPARCLVVRTRITMEDHNWIRNDRRSQNAIACVRMGFHVVRPDDAKRASIISIFARGVHAAANTEK